MRGLSKEYRETEKAGAYEYRPIEIRAFYFALLLSFRTEAWKGKIPRSRAIHTKRHYEESKMK